MRKDKGKNKPALLHKQIPWDRAHAYKQRGRQRERHGELVEPCRLIRVKGIPFPRQEPQCQYEEYGQQRAHKTADIHDSNLSTHMPDTRVPWRTFA